MTKIAGSGSGSESDPNPLVRGMDPRIRIHTRMSWIWNTGWNFKGLSHDGGRSDFYKNLLASILNNEKQIICQPTSGDLSTSTSFSSSRKPSTRSSTSFNSPRKPSPRMSMQSSSPRKPSLRTSAQSLVRGSRLVSGHPRSRPRTEH
jgi:hypothetical protein